MKVFHAADGYFHLELTVERPSGWTGFGGIVSTFESKKIWVSLHVQFCGDWTGFSEMMSSLVFPKYGYSTVSSHVESGQVLVKSRPVL